MRLMWQEKNSLLKLKENTMSQEEKIDRILRFFLKNPQWQKTCCGFL
jgi:hypothetical protein